jgi:hypothetical protein
MKNNKMKMKFVLFLGFSLIVLSAFVSCQQKIGQTTATLPPTAMANATLSQSPLDLLTASPMSTTTVEVKETATPSSNLIISAASPTIVPMTITPSSTLVFPTIVPVTLTPLPTLEGEALESSVAELLAKPMNCDVPCWWGAVPNETTVFEIQQLLALYQFEDYYRRDDDYNQIPDYIEVWFTEDKFDFRVMYSFQNDILQTVFSEQSPPLYEMLKRYGKPDEVWLATGITPLPIPIRLNLVYYQEGMAFGYVADGTIQNNVITGCFASNKTGHLRLIPPNSATSYMVFPKIFFSDFLYLPLTEATDITMDDFMQHFSDPTQPQCIETPADLWK